MTTALDDADLALRHFDGAAALAGYEAALDAGPDPQGRAGAGRVRALWLLRRWDDARQQLDALPEGYPAWLARGVVALGQPDYAAWLAVDRGSAKRDDRAASYFFKKAREHDAHNSEAIAGYATSMRMSGQPTRAREHLLRLPQQDRETARVQVELAMCAAELDDLDVAAEHARHAIAIEPDHVHASLVLLEVSTRIGRDLHKLAEEAAALVEKYSVPDVRIMYDRVLSATGEYKLAAEAFIIDVPHPSAVDGAMLVLPADAAVRSTIFDEALRAEPSSPLLLRRLAQQAYATGPEQALARWRTVLDADPRDLDARIATAEALAALDRTDEARAVVDRLRTELPGNVRVTEAWVRLATPWRMPDTIPTRITRPWESGRDDRKVVLPMLVAEVVENLQLSREVADRLEARLSVDSGHVHRQAADDEQAYLDARDEHMTAVAHAQRHKHLRFTGALLENFVYAAWGSSTGLLVWLLLDLTNLPRPLAIGLSVVLGAVAFGALASELLWNRSVAVFDATFALAFVGSLVAVPWQSILWWGVGWGIGISVVVSGALIGLGLFSSTLQDNFGPPSDTKPQEAFDRWLETLYGRGLLPAAAEASSDPESASGVVLPVHCRMVSETATALDTPATRELRRLLRQRSRGSFALAGPRGAGKSTLMERWCAGHFLHADNERVSTRQNLAVKVDAPVGYQSQEFLHHLFGQVCEAVERYLGPPPKLAQRTRGLFARRTVAPVDPAELTAAHLRRRAARERENIRYIRSRTTEGELSVGVPVAGAKGKVAVQRSDVPLNHPELVGRFRDFLREAAEFVASRDGKVLIGIDELDRISNGDDAQRFINELKAVFNVPNCYFLVSVSEDALADFELAAMGMRTVFDSAFDTIVRVDYLEFAQARLLLNRRIIDLPEQFAALAYVLSGGLARELARMAEEIGDDRTADNRDLVSVTTHLVRRQLSRTTRAAADRLSRADDRRAGAVLIPVLDEHPRGAITPEELYTYATRIEETGRTDEEPALVAGTRLDVAAMVRYLAMLLRVFDNTLTGERMAIGRTRGLGDFETFARVRRYLGANPYGALELLKACAKAWRLPPVR